MGDKKESKRNILGYVTKNIYDKSGLLLLVEGTPLSIKIAQKLKERGISVLVAAEPLGLSVKKNFAFFKNDSSKSLQLPQKLDEKFNKIDLVSMGNAASYLNNLLRHVQENIFLRNNIRIVAQGHKATYSHSINVSLITVVIARKLKYDKHSLYEIGLGALYHDIGKIMLPKSVLDDILGVCYGQKLIYQQHTMLGSDLLAEHKFPESVYLIARQHHEKYSGNGYPSGIKGNEINFNAAIVAVADTFDRLTSSVFQKNTLSPDKAINQILLARGIDYHPQVVDSFVDLFNN
jgi:putative nucleotidyltransferase with HDIG domain